MTRSQHEAAQVMIPNSIDTEEINQFTLRGVRSRFVSACALGDRIFVGLQTGMEPQSTLSPGVTMADQTRGALRNVAKALKPFSATLADVIKINAFYVSGNSGEQAAIEARGEFFEIGPVSTGVGASSVFEGTVSIGLEVVAVRGEKTFRRGENDYGYSPATLPFRVIGEAGQAAWIAGVSGTDQSGSTIAPGDAPAQLAATRDVLERRLAGVGAELDDVTQLRCYWSERCGDIPSLMEQRSAWFSRSPAFVDVVIPGFPASELMLEMDVTGIDRDREASKLSPRVRVADGLAYTDLHVGRGDDARDLETHASTAVADIRATLDSVGGSLETIASVHVYHDARCSWNEALRVIEDELKVAPAVSLVGVSRVGDGSSPIGLEAIAGVGDDHALRHSR
jgi:enamine deaminase RidA (YjgF/YER057c/UK114 family)